MSPRPSWQAARPWAWTSAWNSWRIQVVSLSIGACVWSAPAAGLGEFSWPHLLQPIFRGLFRLGWEFSTTTPQLDDFNPILSYLPLPPARMQNVVTVFKQCVSEVFSFWNPCVGAFVQLSDSSHPGGYEVLSHCGSDLHCPDN